jgi:putative membrane protein
MFIQTLIITSAIVAAAQATPPRTTPETRPPAQDPATRTADQPHTDHAGGSATADAAFVKKAADGGLAEVAMAKLAQEKAASADVKAFAQKLEKDHTQANTELKQVASQKNITLPTAPSKMHQAKHDKLSKLSGAEFDKAYVAAMLEDHQKDERREGVRREDAADAEGSPAAGAGALEDDGRQEAHVLVGQRSGRTQQGRPTRGALFLRCERMAACRFASYARLFQRSHAAGTAAAIGIRRSAVPVRCSAVNEAGRPDRLERSKGSSHSRGTSRRRFRIAQVISQ